VKNHIDSKAVAGFFRGGGSGHKIPYLVTIFTRRVRWIFRIIFHMNMLYYLNSIAGDAFAG
jgi:hypothetical protein